MNVLLQQPTTTTTNSHRGEECLYLILRCNLLLFFVILLLYFIYLIFIYAPVFVYFLCKRWRSKVAISNKTHTHTRNVYGSGSITRYLNQNSH